VGIVSRSDVLRVFLRTDGEICDEIRREVIARTLWLDPSRLGVTVSDGVVTLEGQVENHSLADWMATLAAKVDGVVGVENRLTYQIDDRAIPPSALVPYWTVYAPGVRPRRAPGVAHVAEHPA
jgi:osmotically-inducible protein OsmY